LKFHFDSVRSIKDPDCGGYDQFENKMEFIAIHVYAFIQISLLVFILSMLSIPPGLIDYLKRIFDIVLDQVQMFDDRINLQDALMEKDVQMRKLERKIESLERSEKGPNLVIDSTASQRFDALIESAKKKESQSHAESVTDVVDGILSG